MSELANLLKDGSDSDEGENENSDQLSLEEILNECSDTEKEIKHQDLNSFQVAKWEESRKLKVGVGENRISPLNVKRKMIQDKNAKFSKSAGIVKVEKLDIVSDQLYRNMEYSGKGPGGPTAVAIHGKFIAIGTARGLVLVFDHFQNIRQVLGNTVDMDAAIPVTALDVAAGGDFLVCGFQTGRIVLWDMIKGTALKAVSDAHENPIVSLRFYKDLKPCLVSVDTKGIVHKLNFSKMMGYLYVVEKEMILDGAAGKIPSIAILPQAAGYPKCAQITDQYTLVGLSSPTTTFVIAIEPDIRVLHRWPKYEDVQDNSLPCLSFGWAVIADCSRQPAPVLARGWGKHLQLLECTFLGGQTHNHAKHGWPAFDEHVAIRVDSNIVACQWLAEQVVVYLTAKDELVVYDALTKENLEVIDVSAFELVYASYKAINQGEQSARSFSNSVRACNNILYLLGLKELRTARVQPWTQRIDTLVESGEWLEAMALALDHFECVKLQAVDRADRDRFPPVFFKDARGDQSLVDLFKLCQVNQRTGDRQDVFRNEHGVDIQWCYGNTPYSADISQKLEAAYQKARQGPAEAQVPIGVADRVEDLLMDYVRLAITNAPATSSFGSSKSGKTFTLDLTRTHYQLLAGVCIEYCAVIRRTDLLYNDIFKRFQDVDRSDVFVEFLEPYIVSKQLRTLSVGALYDFAEYFTSNGMHERLEQCILSLQVREMETASIIKICTMHKLYSALTYVYNIGLRDYLTPIDILVENCDRRKGSRSTGNKDVGYKLLVYISYCFEGKEFPSAVAIPKNQVPAIRSQICRHIFGYEADGDSLRKSNDISSTLLTTLISIDCEIFFGILADLFDAPDADFEPNPGTVVQEKEVDKYKTAHGPTKCPSLQAMVIALAETVIGGAGEDTHDSTFSAADKGHMYMLEARLLSAGIIDVKSYAAARNGSENSTWMMDTLMRYLTTGSFKKGGKLDATQSNLGIKERQAMLVRLIQKMPKHHYDEATLLRLVLRENLNRAAVVMYKARSDYRHTLKYYLADDDKEYQVNAFSYTRQEIEKHDATTNRSSESSTTSPTKGDLSTTRKEIEEGILQHAAKLLMVDAFMFVTLVLEFFSELNNKIIRTFVSLGDEGLRLEYEYLSRMIGVSNKVVDGDQREVLHDLMSKTNLKMNTDAKVQERYVVLLCKFKPSDLFGFLEAHDNYSLEKCLKLCKENKVTDAEAYLLERTGDVTGALSLILQSIEEKLKILKPALRGCKSNIDPIAGPRSRSILKENFIDSSEEGKDVMRTLDVGIAMCQRNSARHRDEQSEQLWFSLLDAFLKVQKYVKHSIKSKHGSGASRITTQTAMQSALNYFIRIVLERMSVFVSLTKIFHKIITEHGKDDFGDFRHTIFGMLDTYNYEQNIYQTANSLISNDLYEQLSTLRSLQSRPVASASNQCSYCHVLLSKPPFGTMMNENVAWNRQSAMVTILAPGHLYHESCSKLIHTKNVSSTTKPVITERESKPEEIEPSTKSRKHINSRRYLTRLKKARKQSEGPSNATSILYQTFDSLAKNETTRNKFLRNHGTTFSLAPAARFKSKRTGIPDSASLPIKSVQFGKIG